MTSSEAVAILHLSDDIQRRLNELTQLTKEAHIDEIAVALGKAMESNKRIHDVAKVVLK